MLRWFYFSLLGSSVVLACTPGAARNQTTLPTSVEPPQVFAPESTTDGPKARAEAPPQHLDWDQISEFSKPSTFHPHVANSKVLEPTLRWLQSLRDEEGQLGQTEGGPLKQGPEGLVFTNPDVFNCQDFRTWTVDDLNRAHYLDLAGLDYATEDLRLLEPLVELRALKLTRPLRPRPDGSPDQGLAHVAKLPKLSHLDLASFALEHEGLAALGPAPSLVQLDISSNPTLGFDALVSVSKLSKLRWLALEDCCEFNLMSLRLDQLDALEALFTALPTCEIEGHPSLTPDYLAAVDSVGPHALMFELDAVVRPETGELELSATLTNTGAGPVRLSDYPIDNLNGGMDRFADGSLFRVVDSQGRWTALDEYSYGGNNRETRSRADLLVLGAGEHRSWTWTFTFDERHEALVIGDHDEVSDSHRGLGFASAPARPLTLGIELRQEAEQFKAHNVGNGLDPQVHVRALRESDWKGVVRSNTVKLTVSPTGQLRVGAP